MQGIYKIENLINHKVYIGQSTNIEARWQHHITYLNENIHNNPHLQNAWNKYGSNHFSFSIIEECDYDVISDREQYWIDYYGGLESENTYNLRDAYVGGHLSEETRKRISIACLGKEPWNKGLTKETDDRVRQYVEKSASVPMTNQTKEKIRNTVKKLHREGVYDYSSITKKRLESIKSNGTIRKDRGVKRGNYSDEWCNNISKGKLEANRRKRELGLPVRIKKKPTPMKTTVCEFCGNEFQQRQCHYKKYCSRYCYQQSRKENYQNEIIGCKVQTKEI